MNASEKVEKRQSRSPYRADTTFPLGSEDLDPFGHRDYVASIRAAIQHVPSQFTLGLFGPWGSGKSTILEEVARQTNEIDRPSVAESWRAWWTGGRKIREIAALRRQKNRREVLVVFDAWRFDGDSLRREFIRTVAEQLEALAALPASFNVEKQVEAFEVDISRPREARPRLSWASALSGLFSALIVAAVIGLLYAALAIFDPSDDTRVKAEIAIIGPLLAFVLVVTGRLVAPIQIQESRRRFEFPEQFTKAFQALLDDVRAERVVIAVDNLDRCSPKRVAEMLTTIKTFLEPALDELRNPGAKSLCFIIAADDEAVRRHLIAEEMAASAVEGRSLRINADRDEQSKQGDDVTETGVAGVENVAREAVDEYLRKFFNGSIRITDMLDEDMRDFTRAELADFVAWREVDEDTEQRLVELTAHGLKGNPRRIKQFVNNLELRLQLFQDRRSAERIQIEPEVMVVAKLAILEEEFPDAYRALREDPSLLDRWHKDAESEESSLPQRLVGFLRFTNDIDTPYIAAYLSFKQTHDELTLPGYEEFIGLLDESNFAVLDNGFERMSEDALGRHVQAARDHFDRCIQRRSWSSAYGTARSVIETPALHGIANELVSHVIDRALTHPELRSRLLSLNPEALLDAGLDSLSVERAADLVEALVVETSANPEVFDDAATALATLADRFDNDVRQRLKIKFSEEPLRLLAATNVPLAENLPELIDRKAMVLGIEELIESEEFSGDDPRLRVAVAVLPVVEAASEPASRLISGLRLRMQALRAEGGVEYNRLAEAAIQVAGLANDPGVHVALAEELVTSWDELAHDVRSVSLGVALAVCRASADADASYGEPLGRHVIEVEGEWMPAGVLAEEFSTLPSGFKAGVLKQLRAGTSGELDSLPTFVDYADRALEGAVLESLYIQAAKEAIAARRYGTVEFLIPRVEKKAAIAMATGLADQAEAEPGAFVEAGAGAMGLLVEVQSLIGPDRIEALVPALIDAFVERRNLAPEVGPVIGKLKIKDPSTRNAQITRLIEFEKEVQNVDRRQGILQAAFLMAGRRRSKARSAIDERLDEMSTAGGADGQLAERVRGSG